MGYKKMNIKTIKTDKAPQAIGPYSQAKVVNGFIYTSGQIPLKSDGSLVEGNFENECIQVLENIKSILEESNSSLNNVIKDKIKYCLFFIRLKVLD